MTLPLMRAAARHSLGGNNLHVPTYNIHNRTAPSFLSSIVPIPRSTSCSQRPISNATASTYKQESRHTNEEQDAHHKQNNPQLASRSQPVASSPTISTSTQVRLLMRQVPYPVAIITATDPTTSPSETTSFRGMTVSSFNTVTLHPEPVISFNVKRPSETLNALIKSGRFLVHLLASSPATATLARDFSKGNTTLASILSGHGDFEFSPLSTHEHSERPLPLLRRRGSDSSHQVSDFPFVLECTLHQNILDVHDHSVVLGTVVRTIESPVTHSHSAHSPEHLCLTYANTKFWKMGHEI
ncbi:hypothetical protein N7539_001182 [Penicillium diatomitis]|uniref:Flavin reductase like domain-containing protein n=1 Tax=Penicillium diatomitis TaxID=2819901 RepID=A0A9W9XN71_9EURO|nr:uncharacterized protein N7539_001182 [Penicillium diatomitis]KAJ5496066.1 hypothetical protein N7539_001182 [Penicillium diatomitis]